ncbi:MAG: HicB family protein [Candidatus Vogelbacteria bacterium CG10_big_fil_rev_8_21_14_0_10_45_14]|uniref:HicB family protein n=1 Tax=Candidatus Vogelbacteria bacterium CG10_big_fil_rev_8_21_14_0_10_45_14 TaxID=1975042 RepID=A0A2H0RJ63_9BACT|nr:MAG: HicB family protein [Candidatus Vogelbacteria bacterium CG10_big_fil_rev_8_21_14_0_10_45_14]
MKRINMQNITWREGRQYVSWNLNTGVSSFGDTRNEALDSLSEALSLYLEDAPPTCVQKIEQPNIVASVLEYA